MRTPPAARLSVQRAFCDRIRRPPRPSPGQPTGPHRRLRRLYESRPLSGTKTVIDKNASLPHGASEDEGEDHDVDDDDDPFSSSSARSSASATFLG